MVLALDCLLLVNRVLLLLRHLVACAERACRVCERAVRGGGPVPACGRPRAQPPAGRHAVRRDGEAWAVRPGCQPSARSILHC